MGETCWSEYFRGKLEYRIRAYVSREHSLLLQNEFMIRLQSRPYYFRNEGSNRQPK
jgi:hypothetical protein